MPGTSGWVGVMFCFKKVCDDASGMTGCLKDVCFTFNSFWLMAMNVGLPEGNVSPASATGRCEELSDKKSAAPGPGGESVSGCWKVIWFRNLVRCFLKIEICSGVLGVFFSSYGTRNNQTKGSYSTWIVLGLSSKYLCQKDLFSRSVYRYKAITGCLGVNINPILLQGTGCLDSSSSLDARIHIFSDSSIHRQVLSDRKVSMLISGIKT